MPVLSNFRQARPIIDFDGNLNQREDFVYRIRGGWDGEGFQEQIDALAACDELEELRELVIGFWGYDYGSDSFTVEARDALLALAPRLENLEGLFWGDFSYDECEISWMENTDIGAFLTAFPNLEYLGARGGMGLGLGNCSHPKLKHLEIQTGGMDGGLIRDIASGDLPALERLELWTGSSDYGFTGSLDDLKPFVIGNGYPDFDYPFPKMKYLGLMNCEYADELAELFQGAPILEQLEVLDFSMGTMTDRGAQALLENEAITNLRVLDLEGNMIEDEDLIEQLRALDLAVIASDQRDNEWGRYVQVGE